jgi:hypothetical protein
MAILLSDYLPETSIPDGVGNDLETITVHWPPAAWHIHHFFAAKGYP